MSDAHIQIPPLQWLWIINDVQAFCPMTPSIYSICDVQQETGICFFVGARHHARSVRLCMWTENISTICCVNGFTYCGWLTNNFKVTGNWTIPFYFHQHGGNLSSLLESMLLIVLSCVHPFRFFPWLRSLNCLGCKNPRQCPICWLIEAEISPTAQKSDQHNFGMSSLYQVWASEQRQHHPRI